MFLKIFIDLIKQDGGFFKKIKKLLKFVKYYNNFQKGIRSESIYHNVKIQNPIVKDLFDSFSNDDFILEKKLFHQEIIEFLKKNKLKKNIDCDKKIGLEQVSHNIIYVNEPISGLWTTGRVSFFLPTKKGLKNKISIIIRSIPPLKVTIGIGESPSKTIQMSKLSTKVVELSINPKEIIDDISEIYIMTDRMWLPHVILDTNENIALGIGIKSISVSYF